MLKSTRKFGLGVLLVVAPLLAAIFGIATGDFFFDSEGKVITLLIIIGFGMFSAMSFYAATKMNVSDNAKSALEEAKAKEAPTHHTKNVGSVKKGFVHP